MPFVESYTLDPSQVLLFPWMWKEITHEQALLMSSFTTIVVVHGAAFGLTTSTFTADWRANTGMWANQFTPARYYIQIGFAPTAAASVVPSTMSFSDDGVDFLGKGYENPTEKGWDAKQSKYFQYDDGYGFQTIGYGHKIKKGEDFSKGLSKQENIDLFKADIKDYVDAVNDKLTKGVTQQQFDALVILQFNLGPNATTQPVKQINAGVAVTEADFTKYTHVKGTKPGVVNKGLLARRKGEWNIFSTGVYDATH